MSGHSRYRPFDAYEVGETDRSLVLEVAFDSIQPSTRHPSGLALRFPRIKNLRRDKTVAEIDTLQSSLRLAAGHRGADCDFS